MPSAPEPCGAGGNDRSEPGAYDGPLVSSDSHVIEDPLLWQRGLPARLVVASVYLFTFVAALDLWIFRIMTTRQ